LFTVHINGIVIVIIMKVINCSCWRVNHCLCLPSC